MQCSGFNSSLKRVEKNPETIFKHKDFHQQNILLFSSVYLDELTLSNIEVDTKVTLKNS